MIRRHRRRGQEQLRPLQLLVSPPPQQTAGSSCSTMDGGTGLLDPEGRIQSSSDSSAVSSKAASRQLSGASSHDATASAGASASGGGGDGNTRTGGGGVNSRS